jgi:hypothetical protein
VIPASVSRASNRGLTWTPQAFILSVYPTMKSTIFRETLAVFHPRLKRRGFTPNIW